ncbi:tetratricopeptide repeat protein [Pseudomonas chengduensis]|nr:tetratricopeptide repeat protein [Pseudomonas chengduensis]MDH1560646.1 tetratricopeptide repeat protein [Pseudomonas chengduensis]
MLIRSKLLLLPLPLPLPLLLGLAGAVQATEECATAVQCNQVGSAAYQDDRFEQAIEAFERQLRRVEDDDTAQLELALNNLILANLRAGDAGQAVWSELLISEDGNGGYHGSFSPVRAGARVEEYGPAAIGELDGKLVGDGVQMRLEDAGLGSGCAVQLLREGIELRVQEVFAEGCQDYGGMSISVGGRYIKVSP